MTDDDADNPPPAASPDREPTAQERRSAAEARIKHQHSWVDLQIRQAQERGAFDDLPGLGRPIEGLGAEHDPDWWVKKLVEREQIVVLPPSLQVRKDDAALDALLDRQAGERDVRREVEEFNARVRSAMIQPHGGPPMITKLRDVDTEVQRWSERRTARLEQARRLREAAMVDRATAVPGRRRWWRRGWRRGRPGRGVE